MAFDAKVDVWFLACFYGGGLVMLASVPASWRRGGSARGLAVVLAIIGLLFVGVGWRVSVVDIVITDDGYLDSTGWPFDGRFTAISSIRAVTQTDNGRASFAASFDRLRVDHGEDRVVFIAVEDKPAFLDALVAADGGLRRTATGATRAPLP